MWCCAAYNRLCHKCHEAFSTGLVIANLAWSWSWSWATRTLIDHTSKNLWMWKTSESIVADSYWIALHQTRCRMSEYLVQQIRRDFVAQGSPNKDVDIQASQKSQTFFTSKCEYRSSKSKFVSVMDRECGSVVIMPACCAVWYYLIFNALL